MSEASLRWYYKNRAKAAARARTYYAANKVSLLIKQQIYRSANKCVIAEKDRLRVRRWKAANWPRVLEQLRRRTALHSGATLHVFSAAQLSLRLSMFGGRCWVCGESATSVDHVKPLSKGGAHALCNLRPACGTCNSSKGNRWPLAFLANVMPKLYHRDVNGRAMPCRIALF